MKRGLRFLGILLTVMVCPVLTGQENKLSPAKDVPKEVTAWMKRAAIPLVSVSPTEGLKDMTPLGAVIGNARIVAMGEATHGTREFFQLKHRMLEFLVEKKGFTLFGIEANWPESLAVNEYVLNGTGDAAQVLDGLYFWTWNTEEVLDLIRWMRRYNQDPKHTKKVKFFGFDMQVAHLAARNVEMYLAKVDPGEARVAAKLLAPVSDAKRERESANYKSIFFWQKMDERIGYLLEQLEGRKKAYVDASSLSEWTFAEHNLESVRQAAETYSVDRLSNSSPRDGAMAANVKWILDQEGPDAKIMLWAHNGHVATAKLGAGDSMGMILREMYGEEMVVCGLAFGQGSFQALERGRGLRQFTVGPANPGTLEAAMSATGIPVFAIDLRSAPSTGAVGTWLNEQQQMRNIGAIYSEGSSDMNMFSSGVDRHTFDVMFFVERTTAARENPKYSELEFRGGL
jgi:erythromycin esterase